MLTDIHRSTAQNAQLIIIACLCSIICITLQGCSSFNRKTPAIDEYTRQHPATKVFLSYIKRVQASAKFEETLEFYSDKDQQTIKRATGWALFVYTSPFDIFKKGEGSCDTISAKALGTNRVQLDCTGSFIYHSYFLPDSVEQFHLRVFMNLSGEKWRMGRSGYVHTQGGGKDTRFIGRVGLKFESIYEKK